MADIASVDTSGLPSPLVPFDCDLRDMPSMMVEIPRVMQSKAWLRAAKVPFLAFRLMNLWMRAFHEVPAGSIENDDDVLCDAAKCPPADWEAERSEVLRGWVACSDGRIYHPVVAEKALELWARKVKQRHGAAEGRARKAWSRRGKEGDAPELPFLPWLLREYPATYAMADKVFPSEEIEGWKPQPVSPGQSQVSSGQAPMSTGQKAVSTGQDQMSDGNRSKSKGNESEGNGSNSVEDKSSTGAVGAGKVVVLADMADGDKPAWWPKTDRLGRVTSEVTERVVFDTGKWVLGKTAGGLITRMLKAYNGDKRAVVDFLLQAEAKADPKEWFAKVLTNAERDQFLEPNHVIYHEAHRV